jgi:glycosyltransferase involved in cell wall biosynthesis
MRPSERSLSVVLPVHQQADHIVDVVSSLYEAVADLASAVQFVVVVNASTDASAELCRGLAARFEGLVVLERAAPGWGAAVRDGLAHANGDVIVFTNSARTTGADLRTAVALAMLNPDHAVKAVRRTRDRLFRRLGSVLYNFEAKALFGLASWDVNGTPKVFPREFAGLLALAEGGDLLDLEWLVTCDRQSYPLIEFPVTSVRRHGGKSTTRVKSAFRMYWGALRLRRRLGQPAPASPRA